MRLYIKWTGKDSWIFFSCLLVAVVAFVFIFVRGDTVYGSKFIQVVWVLVLSVDWVFAMYGMAKSIPNPKPANRPLIADDFLKERNRKSRNKDIKNIQLV